MLKDNLSQALSSIERVTDDRSSLSLSGYSWDYICTQAPQAPDLRSLRRVQAMIELSEAGSHTDNYGLLSPVLDVNLNMDNFSYPDGYGLPFVTSDSLDLVSNVNLNGVRMNHSWMSDGFTTSGEAKEGQNVRAVYPVKPGNSVFSIIANVKWWASNGSRPAQAHIPSIYWNPLLQRMLSENRIMRDMSDAKANRSSWSDLTYRDKTFGDGSAVLAHLFDYAAIQREIMRGKTTYPMLGCAVRNSQRKLIIPSACDIVVYTQYGFAGGGPLDEIRSFSGSVQEIISRLCPGDSYCVVQGSNNTYRGAFRNASIIFGKKESVQKFVLLLQATGNDAGVGLPASGVGVQLGSIMGLHPIMNEPSFPAAKSSYLYSCGLNRVISNSIGSVNTI